MEADILNFRPCIDLHQGKVKQVVGETLHDNVIENFVSELDSSYYAKMFQQDHIHGGHVIKLGEGNEAAAEKALQAYPGGLQLGGSVTAENAARYLEQGASHVIVTSYIFKDGRLNEKHLSRILSEIGKEKLVIDLSCKEKDGRWYVVTNGWKLFSDFEVNQANIIELEQYCSEFLIHAVDVEGKQRGIQEHLAGDLSEWVSIPATYAGGVRSLSDLDRFREITGGQLDITIGSALSIFGGPLAYQDVLNYFSEGKH